MLSMSKGSIFCRKSPPLLIEFCMQIANKQNGTITHREFHSAHWIS